MWKKIAIVVVVAIGAVLAYAATRPDDFTVQRSIAIKAEPAKIYPLLVDFGQWPAWSPWEKLDPTMKRTLSGQPRGAGAVYAWDGSSKVGAGRMEVKEAVAPSKVVIVIAVVVAAVLIFAATRPGDFTVQRSIAIKAEPAKIYPLIADFRQWPAWSPWEKLDPTMKRTLSGAASGSGAVYAWEGSSKVGAGRMEIKDATAPAKVVIQLDFIRPFEAHNVTDFTLAPRGDGTTEVNWLMRGPATFVTKLMGIFVSMDKMVGKDFETGLANLKAAAEK